MMIYIADRRGKVLTSAATDLPGDSAIRDDKITDDLSTGVKVFECTLMATPDLRLTAVPGNYVMAYERPFTIITSRFSTKNNTIELYCEDAGLDLINKVVGTVKATTKKLSEWIIQTLGSEEASGWKYNINITDSAETLEYISEATAMERLLDILDNYDAELYFSYEIEGFEWVTRTINIVKKRGNSENIYNLHMNKEILSISEEQSVIDLANVYVIYGKDNKPLKSLEGYSSVAKSYPANESRMYSYEVVDNEVRCIDSINRWKTKLDSNGKIKQVKYTNYSKASNAIGYAIRMLEQIAEPVYSYEVEFLYLPDDIQCGDYVNVLDDSDNIFVKGRVLTLSRSETKQSIEATLGDFALLQGNMADIDFGTVSMYSINVSSSNGTAASGEMSTELTATVWYNGAKLEALFTGELKWYMDDIEVTNTDPTVFPYVTDGGFKLVTGALTEGHNFICRLED